MKKMMFYTMCFVLLAATRVFATTSSADNFDIGRASATTVSTAAYTAVPSTPTIHGSRVGVWVDVPAYNVNNVYMQLSTMTGGPTSGVNVGMMLRPSDPPLFLPIGPNVYTFFQSSGAALVQEKVFAQDVLGEKK